MYDEQAVQGFRLTYPSDADQLYQFVTSTRIDAEKQARDHTSNEDVR